MHACVCEWLLLWMHLMRVHCSPLLATFYIVLESDEQVFIFHAHVHYWVVFGPFNGQKVNRKIMMAEWEQPGEQCMRAAIIMHERRMGNAAVRSTEREWRKTENENKFVRACAWAAEEWRDWVLCCIIDWPITVRVIIHIYYRLLFIIYSNFNWISRIKLWHVCTRKPSASGHLCMCMSVCFLGVCKKNVNVLAIIVSPINFHIHNYRFFALFFLFTHKSQAARHRFVMWNNCNEN